MADFVAQQLEHSAGKDRDDTNGLKQAPFS